MPAGASKLIWKAAKSKCYVSGKMSPDRKRPHGWVGSVGGVLARTQPQVEVEANPLSDI